MDHYTQKGAMSDEDEAVVIGNHLARLRGSLTPPSQTSANLAGARSKHATAKASARATTKTPARLVLAPRASA